MASVVLRDDFDAASVRRLARDADDADQARRLLAIAAVYDGMSRADAARIGGMDRQTLRDWAHRFNAEGAAGLVNRTAPGNPRRLTPEQEAELERLVEAGPAAAGLGHLARWRCADLAALIAERWGVDYHERTIGKLLDRLDFSHITTRPQHYRQDQAAWRRSKNFPDKVAAIRGEQPLATPIEIWFQDEMRIGQKTQRTRVWAKRGTRPRQVADLRTGCAYLFGAICPGRRTGAAVVMPRADTQGMQHHLDEISANVSPRAHAILVLDQAGWHTTGKLKVPDNITLLPLPPRSPELNPAENVWEYLRGRWLSNHVFKDYDAALDAVCDAWNRLIAEPDRIQSLGARQWANCGGA